MASTARAGEMLPVVGTTFANGFVLAAGVATLSSGTVEVVTGLSSVEMFVATECSGVADKAAALAVMEDLPLASGTVTVDGTLCTQGADAAGDVDDTTSEQFSWIAIGRR